MASVPKPESKVLPPTAPVVEPTTQPRVVTTSTPVVDQLWGVVTWGWATLRGDYSGPQKAMEDFFVDDQKTATQKIDHLVAQYRSLGLKGDGLFAFVEKLVFAPEGAVLKDEFRPIFTAMKGFSGLPDFVRALEGSAPEDRTMLCSLKEALRSDPTFLAGETSKVMASKLPTQQKAVHLMLFLNLRGVSDEQARECFDKIPAEEQAFFGEDAVDLETVTVEQMRGVVQGKLAPLAVLEVMQSFQAQGFEGTVTKLHEDMLVRELRQPLLNLQVVVKEEKDKKKLQTEEVDLAASVVPGTAVQYRLFSILGVEFNHFTGCDESKPCGDVATEALKRMIAELKKAAEAKK